MLLLLMPVVLSRPNCGMEDVKEVAHDASSALRTGVQAGGVPNAGRPLPSSVQVLASALAELVRGGEGMSGPGDKRAGKFQIHEQTATLQRQYAGVPGACWCLRLRRLVL